MEIGTDGHVETDARLALTNKDLAYPILSLSDPIKPYSNLSYPYLIPIQPYPTHSLLIAMPLA